MSALNARLHEAQRLYREVSLQESCRALRRIGLVLGERPKAVQWLRWAWLFAQVSEADLELSMRLGRRVGWPAGAGFCLDWMIRRCERLLKSRRYRPGAPRLGSGVHK
jgi:hypothetical protein